MGEKLILLGTLTAFYSSYRNKKRLLKSSSGTIHNVELLCLKHKMSVSNVMLEMTNGRISQIEVATVQRCATTITMVRPRLQSGCVMGTMVV